MVRLWWQWDTVSVGMEEPVHLKPILWSKCHWSVWNWPSCWVMYALLWATVRWKNITCLDSKQKKKKRLNKAVWLIIMRWGRHDCLIEELQCRNFLFLFSLGRKDSYGKTLLMFQCVSKTIFSPCFGAESCRIGKCQQFCDILYCTVK